LLKFQWGTQRPVNKGTHTHTHSKWWSHNLPIFSPLKKEKGIHYMPGQALKAPGV